jgi:hypothetical protein
MPGSFGASDADDGAVASTKSSARSGVFARNDATDQAVVPGGNGVLGVTVAPGGSGVFGANNAPAGSPGRGVQGNGPEAGVGGFSDQGIGVLAQSNKIGLKAQAPIAGRFEGDVEVSGDIKLLGADVAEAFDVADANLATPGTVMVMNMRGALTPATSAYDKAVAGVVSGAGAFRPGVLLDSAESKTDRAIVALVGKVYCHVDAHYGAIEVGDLLTTSPTMGYAMKASDPARALGSILGKAMRSVSTGQALIPILIALQ